jgi:hypothetical protein
MNSNETFVTPYRIAKMLEEAGVPRKPQQMYRYIAQNIIPSQNVNGQKLVTLEDAELFVSWFAQKHASK